jgi:hypothetical protein
MSVLRTGNPNRICLHHAAVNGVPADLPALRKRLAGYEVTHSKKTWAETTKTKGEYGYYYLAYHIAIAGNGHELRTQDDKYVMYHAGDNARGVDSFNLHGIGVLIDGNYMTDQPNANQLEAFARIIARFEKQYGVDVLVRGHKQTSLTGTSCPGTNLGDNTAGFLKNAITRANEIIKNNLPTNPLQEDPIVLEPTECEKQVKRLEEQLSACNEALGASRASVERLTVDLGLAKERVEFLEGTMAIRETEYKDLELELKNSEEEVVKIKEERDRFEKQYIDVVTELNELKAGRDDWINRIADVLHKLFGMK